MPLLIILFFIGGNFYVFQRIWVAMPPSTIGKVSLIAYTFIVVLCMILAFAADNAMPIGLSQFTFRVGTSWLIILLFFFIVFLFQDILGLANKVLHFMPSDALSRYTKDNWVGFGFIVGFVALFMVCGYFKYQWKVRVPVSITVDKLKTDSATLQPMRIVAISDLHLGYNIGKNEFEHWIDLINKENPDIVLIGGDIVDSNPRPLIEGNFAESFSKFNAPVYACLGNHEYISDIKGSLKFLEQTNIHLLRDSVAEIGNSLYIIGRDDKWNTNRKSIPELISGLDTTKAMILLDHQPFHLEEAAENNIDMQFSGHTHGGQVFPISLITKKIFEIDHGYKKKSNTHVLVSSGVGIWGGKFRIGTQSEYLVIDINKSE